MPNDFVCHAEVVARKAHRCEECGAVIAPGATYHRESGCFDGNMYSSKSCMTCAALVKWCWANDVFDYDQGREFGNMTTDLEERGMLVVDLSGEKAELVLTPEGARWLEMDAARNFPKLRAQVTGTCPG